MFINISVASANMLHIVAIFTSCKLSITKFHSQTRILSAHMRERQKIHHIGSK